MSNNHMAKKTSKFLSLNLMKPVKGNLKKKSSITGQPKFRDWNTRVMIAKSLRRAATLLNQHQHSRQACLRLSLMDMELKEMIKTTYRP